MWERIALPRLSGRVQAVSEPFAERLVVWTTAGIVVIKLNPRVKVMERLTLERGRERIDLADGTFTWRGIRYRMHGTCSPDNSPLGEPLPLTNRLGQHLEFNSDTLLIRDIAGKVRQTIKGCDPKPPWSAFGFCSDGQEYLMVAHSRSMHLYRFAGSAQGCGAAWQRTGNAADQQGFINAMQLEPDDDALRLVNADWLEEHGDPERAEFIRLQCRIAQRECEVDVPFDDPDQQRAQDLGNAHGDRWAAELPALPRVRYSFQQAFRGFPLVSFNNADGLLKSGPAILAFMPIESVHFWRLPCTQLVRLFKSTMMERIARLSVYDLPTGAEKELTAWLTSQAAFRLRRLELFGGCADWSAVLRAVATSRHLCRLEKLQEDSHMAAPAEDAVLALARSPRLPRLRYVSFAWWHEYPERTKAELRQRFPSIPLR